MKCLLKEQLIQRTGITPDETQEEPGPESPHSARNLHVPVAPDPGRVTEHRRVKWPPASKGRQWLQFDDDVDTILESAAKGDTDGKLKTMATIIISLAVERFGTVEKLGTKTPYMNNRRAEKISQLRQELRVLKRQYKVAREEERDALSELRGILRKKLTTLRRAEWHRRRGKERAKRTPLESPSSCLGKNEVETLFVPKRRSTTISATHTVMLLGRNT